jgi:uncharacterized membrane protein YfcA
VPGIVLGARLAPLMQERVIRVLLAVVLAIVGARLIAI